MYFVAYKNTALFHQKWSVLKSNSIKFSGYFPNPKGNKSFTVSMIMVR
jgi:hypothetical protein